jgi:hypothetical protein
MELPVTRRRFLRSCGTLAAGGLLLGTASPAQAAYEFRFTHDNDFTGNWVPWLRHAVGHATRMIQAHVIANGVRLSGNGYNLAGGVWERSNLANNPVPYWRHYARVMEWQLASLRVNHFQPALHIRWAFEPNAPWWGRANLNTAALVYNQRTNDVEMEGGFEIQLNAYWATTNDRRNSYDVWGGVIAHEMLHNLGHGHDNPQSYDDRWPINVMDRCVTYNGNYRGGYREYNWLCGGRLS